MLKTLKMMLLLLHRVRDMCSTGMASLGDGLQPSSPASAAGNCPQPSSAAFAELATTGSLPGFSCPDHQPRSARSSNTSSSGDQYAATPWSQRDRRSCARLGAAGLLSKPPPQTNPRSNPMALRTHILRLLGPKTMLYKAFGLF